MGLRSNLPYRTPRHEPCPRTPHLDMVVGVQQDVGGLEVQVQERRAMQCRKFMPTAVSWMMRAHRSQGRRPEASSFSRSQSPCTP